MYIHNLGFVEETKNKRVGGNCLEAKLGIKEWMVKQWICFGHNITFRQKTKYRYEWWGPFNLALKAKRSMPFDSVWNWNWPIH